MFILAHRPNKSPAASSIVVDGKQRRILSARVANPRLFIVAELRAKGDETLLGSCLDSALERRVVWRRRVWPFGSATRAVAGNRQRALVDGCQLTAR